MKRNKLGLAALVLGTLLFGAAISLRLKYNPWLSNAGVALVVLILSVAVLWPTLRDALRIDVKTAVGAVVLAVVMVAATHGCYAVATMLFPSLTDVVADLYTIIDGKHLPHRITVLLIFFVVIAEEFLWRGIAVLLCERRLNPFYTGLAVTILYTLPQVIGGSWVLIAAAMIAGGIFTVERLITGRLAAPIITHFLWSASVFAVIPLQ